MARSHAESTAELKNELAYQANRIGKEIAEGSAYVADSVERGAADVVAAIQQTCDYLGGELTEVRWAIEQVLQILLTSLDNSSRQYFEQGVKCYDTGENEFARERFSKALEANRTNYFAYQYLGFIAVAEENPNEAIRNFELAQKFAEQAFHRALALSHLARAKRAVGESEKAVLLCKEATAVSPTTPKFWYELAGHCVQVRRGDEMISALQNAIERDWNYWTVVSSDDVFDVMRPRVNTLLTQLRTQEAGKARARIDELRKVVNTAKTVGAEAETLDAAAAVRDLEAQLDQNNIYLHLEIQRKAPAWQKKTLQTAAKIVDQRIASIRAEASKCQAEKQVRLHALNAEISKLLSKQWEVKHAFKPIEMGCLWYTGLWFLSAFMLAEILANETGPLKGLALLSFVFPPIAIWVLNTIRRLITVIQPVKALDRQIKQKERALEGDKRQIDSEFRPRESQIQIELERLEGYKTLCTTG